MIVRLGFAIAAHLEPEILVVDEVLAVSNAEFQKKTIGKIQTYQKEKGEQCTLSAIIWQLLFEYRKIVFRVV